MGTDDDFLTPPERILTDSPADAAEPAWVRGRAIELLRSLDEFQMPVGGRQRLLFRLRHRSPRRTFAWLRPIVVGAFLVGIGGGIASAAFTEWPAWVVRSCRNLLSTPSPSEALPPASERPIAARSTGNRLGLVERASAPESGLGGPAPGSVEGLRAPDPAGGPPAAGPRQRAMPHRPLAEGVVRRQPAAPAPSLDDAMLLVEATRALRVERDPRRARALASRYLEGQPGGALADEALAISIEAAVVLRDPDAALLSARYLRRFPHGSFRGLAERTLAAPR